MSAENKLSFDQLPETVAKILTEVNKIRDLVEKDRVPQIPKSTPIGIQEACLILQKAVPTVYALARKKTLPCYKKNGKLYFYEDQLIDWVNSGQRKTMSQISAEIEAETQTNRTKRPTRRY